MCACSSRGPASSSPDTCTRPLGAAIGFNVETVTYKNIKFQVGAAPRRRCVGVSCCRTPLHAPCRGQGRFRRRLQAPLPTALVFLLCARQVWDLGGQTSIRPYWRCYYP